MRDLAIEIEDRPGALAAVGEALGQAGVSTEGGGAWVEGGAGLAHFLFEDADAARRALEAAHIRVRAARDVVVLRLKQDQPGQLGAVARRMAEAGVNIEVVYSDHAHNVVFVVDDLERGRAVAAAWTGDVTPEPRDSGVSPATPRTLSPDARERSSPGRSSRRTYASLPRE